jgi:hypothetical protein
MRLRELQENEVVGLFKEHPLTDLPHAILEMLLDYYNLNSYGMATQKMKELTNSITAQLKQNGYTISHNEDVLQVTKGRDRYVAHEEEIMEMLLNTLFKDGIDEDVTQLKPQTSGTKYPLFSKQNIQKAYDEWYNGAAVDTDIEIIGNDNKRYIIRQNTDGDSQHFKDDHWYLTDANNNIEDTEGYPDPENLLFSHSAEGYEPKKPVDEDGTTDDDLADRIRNREDEKNWEPNPNFKPIWKPGNKPKRFKYKEPFNPRFSHSNMDMDKFDEGMGGSSGGGTAGSAGAGGSSLGLPYPSTYEEENDKFKYRSPVQRQMSLTTEEQGEMFTDHQKMKQMMNEKGWPQDLQTEVLRKYASHAHEGQMFIRNVSYVTTKNLSNYGLLQNTDNMFILSQLPQSAINRINKEWNLKIQPSKFIKMSDLEYQKWINTSGYVSQPTVVIDADVIMAEGKWIASVIRGHRSKLCHVLTPGGPKVKSNDPNTVLSPGNQKELAFVESVLSEEDKLWARDELPQLNIKDFEDSNYILKQFNVDISKLKPVQNERIKGLVNKTIKMLKKGKHKPMVIDKMGYIVNGHHRYDAYNKLIKSGFFKTSAVPVIKVNATIEELIDKYM